MFLFTLIFPKFVFANDWDHVVEDWYIHKWSMKKNGNILIWQLINSEGTYQPTMTVVKSTSILHEYNCSKGTTRVLAIKMHEKEMGEGELIFEGALNDEEEHRPSTPTAELILKAVCER